jgi:hypothetical protein
VLAVVTALAAAYRVPRHRDRRLSEWAMSGTLAALAAGLALQAPALYDAVGEAAGAPHLAQLLVDACAPLSAFGTQVVLLHMLHAPAEAPDSGAGPGAGASLPGQAVNHLMSASDEQQRLPHESEPRPRPLRQAG